MIASLCVFALALLSVNGQFSALRNAPCYYVADMLPSDPSCKLGFTRSAPGKTSPIKGYYVKDTRGFFKRFSNPDCVRKTNAMYIKKSGSSYYMGTTRSKNANNAEFKSCTGAGVCVNNYGVGSQYSKSTYPKVKVTVMALPAAQCKSAITGSSWSANAVDEEEDDMQDILAMLDEAAQQEEQNMDMSSSSEEAVEEPMYDEAQEEDAEIDMSSSSEEAVEEEPMEAAQQEVAEWDIPNEALEFEYKPAMPSNGYTLTVSKWTLLILALIFANLAIMMTIMYLRQKSKNEKVETF